MTRLIDDSFQKFRLTYGSWSKVKLPGGQGTNKFDVCRSDEREREEELLGYYTLISRSWAGFEGVSWRKVAFEGECVTTLDEYDIQEV